MQLCLCKWILLKMLGLYLYTLIISHKSCNLLSILNKLTVQKKCKSLWHIMCFRTKNKQKHNNKTKKSNIKTLAGAGNWTRDLLHPKQSKYFREYISLLKYCLNVRCKQFWPNRNRHSIFKLLVKPKMNHNK